MDAEKLAKVREYLSDATTASNFDAAKSYIYAACTLLDEEQPAKKLGWRFERDQDGTVGIRRGNDADGLYWHLSAQQAYDLLVALRPLAAALADPNNCAEDWEESAQDFLRFLDSVGVTDAD